jgi:hypothetical protein
MALFPYVVITQRIAAGRTLMQPKPIWACNPPMPLNSASESASVRQELHTDQAGWRRPKIKGCCYKKGFIGLERIRCLSA